MKDWKLKLWFVYIPYTIGFIIVTEKLGVLLAFGIFFMFTAFDLSHLIDKHNN
jgi:hypothetical protein